jgi:GNAT superfamily N-acetyltransferase
MNEFNLKIRLADRSDLELILSFIAQKVEFDGYLGELEATVDKLKQTLFCQPPIARILLAEVDEIPVGFALFSDSYSSFLAQRCIWLDDLFIQSHMRGKGIGTALLKHLAQLAESTHCGRIEWTVNESNALGISFYKKQGARIRETTKLCRIDRDAIARLANH